jgi:hypothetical protein
MSTVIEYTLRPKTDGYDALLSQCIHLADDVADHDLSVRRLLVADDPEQRLLRVIDAYGTPPEPEVGVLAAFHRNVCAAAGACVHHPPIDAASGEDGDARC